MNKVQKDFEDWVNKAILSSENYKWLILFNAASICHIYEVLRLDDQPLHKHAINIQKQIGILNIELTAVEVS